MQDNAALKLLEVQTFQFMSLYVVKKFKTCVPGTEEHLESLENLQRIIQVELSIIGDAKDLDLAKIKEYDQEVRALKIYRVFYPLKVLKTFSNNP